MLSQEQCAVMLAEWKGKRIRATDISLEQAADSISAASPIVEARPAKSGGRWILSRTDTGKVAVLTYVGVLAWCGNQSTGNFVPSGCIAPEGTIEGRIQQVPNGKGEISLCFDAFVDPTLYDNIRVLEGNAAAQAAFNQSKKPRGAWQNGAHPSTRNRYIVSSKLFTKKRAGAGNVGYTVHPWIQDALKEESSYMANPERVKFYDCVNGMIRNLEDSTNPALEKNDIVLMTFRLGFRVGPSYWEPEIFPIEVIRLDHIPYSAEGSISDSLYPPLDPEFAPLEAGIPFALLEGPSERVELGKRKTENDNDLDKGEPSDVGIKQKKRATDAEGVMSDITMSNVNVGTFATGVGGSNWALRSMGKGKDKENRSPSIPK